MEDVIFEAENLVDIVPILELLVGEELQHPRHPPYVLQQPRLLLQHNCHPGGGEKIFQLRTERKERPVFRIRLHPNVDPNPRVIKKGNKK